MVGRLDRYSRFVGPEDMGRLERYRRGEYVGIGLEVGVRGGACVVVVPVEGSPAADAGVRTGDVVESIDGRAVSASRMGAVEELLVGRAGSSVRVGFRRGALRFERVMVRRLVGRTTVRGLGSPGGKRFWADEAGRIGYVRLTGFGRGAVEQLGERIDWLAAEGAKGLVLDLRFNPGGLTDEATALVDRFVDEGVVLTTINRRGAVRKFAASPERTRWRMPLAVLVNGASASSAEIVAGSLQDHGRAVLVGERTFGKGSVQDFVRLRGGSAGLRLTVAYYALPSGRRIHRSPGQEASADWGVFPDVPVMLEASERGRLYEVLTFGQGGAGFVDRQLQAAVDVLD